MPAPLGFGYPIDLHQNEIQNYVIQVLATRPTNPVMGQHIFYSATGHAEVFNGTGWEQASGGGGSGSVTTVSATVPAGLAVTVANPSTTPAIAITYATGQVANRFLATPDGAAGALGLRALVAADVPKTLDHTWVTDFDAQVRTSRLDQLAVPTANVALGGMRITGAGDPVNPQDYVTRNYADQAIQGLQTKPTATVATTAALPAYTYANGTAGVGATITFTATGVVPVDGHNLGLNELVLVKDEATGSRHGLYTVTTAPAVGVAGVLTRHPDMDTAGEFSGAFVPVSNVGTANANSLWLANPTGAVTVGTTAIPFTRLNSATVLTAGNGITISGNTVSVTTTARLTFTAGALDLVAGVIATPGTYPAVTVDTYGRVTAGRALVVGDLPAGTARSYAATIGDGTATQFALTHNLGTRDVSVSVNQAAAPYGSWLTYWEATDVNTVTVYFNPAPTANQFRVKVST
jgi:hypothetical protein